MQPRAEFKAVCLNLATRGHNVGYLPGAGDDVAQCVADMGYQVTTLTDSDLTADNLAKFDAIVIGVRAFNVRKDLASHLPALFDYAQAGGNVIEQYNRPGFGEETAYPERPAFDAVVQAMSGLMDLTRSASGDGGTPYKAGISAADLGGGQVALLAVLAALLQRDRSGQGQTIDLSMQDAAAWMTQGAWNAPGRAQPPARAHR